MRFHKSPISGIAAFKNQWVATAGYDNQIILWSKDQPIANNFHDHLANHCTFNSTGDLLASSSSDCTVKIWRVPSLELVTTLVGHTDDVEMAAFSPDGQRIATACRDSYVRVFSVDGELLAKFEGHLKDVISVTWNQSGEELISSGDDGTLRVWSLAEKKMLRLLSLEHVETDTVVISRCGTIFSGNDDGEICVTSENSRSVYAAHRSGIKKLVLSDDQKLLVSLSYDRRVGVFSFCNKKLTSLAQIFYPEIVWARSCAFRGDQEVIFGTFGDRYATLNLKDNKWEISKIQPTPGFNAVADNQGTLLAVGDSGQVFKLEHDKKTLLANFGELCNFIVSHRDKTYVGGHTGKIFELGTGRLIVNLGEPLNCAKSNGQRIVVGSYTGKLFLFDPLNPLEIIQSVLLENAVKAIALSESVGFAVGAAGDACWFEPYSGKKIRNEIQAHSKIANGCSYISGQQFASVSRDRKLRIWQKDIGLVQEIPTPHNHSVKCVASNDRFVVTGSYAGQIAVFDLLLRQWLLNQRPTRSGISSIAPDSLSQNFWASSYDGKVHRIEPQRSIL